ncbi:hypothetical protein IWQ62_001260 [Dispira parvispora]|uniref:Uncharacterized protein n=1 Tax=Dispira parvispora TaxID=1520584 RepID=A0A9W8ASU6_9FUNG|nr:hypothetical protein IWQ62_001260 [Dispira parvispora]
MTILERVYRREKYILENFGVLGKHRKFFDKGKRSPAQKEAKQLRKYEQQPKLIRAKENFSQSAETESADRIRHANRVRKALHTALSADSLPIAVLAPIHWDIEHLLTGLNRSYGFHHQALLEEALRIHEDTLTALVNRRMQGSMKTRLVFRCGQELNHLLDDIEREVDQIKPDASPISTQKSG